MGTHRIVLTVTDDDGLVASDETVVTVTPAASPGSPFRVNYGTSGYSGLNGPTCATSCHLGPNGVAPSLALQGPATLKPGERATYRLTLDPVEPTDQQGAGLDVAVDGGTLFSVPGQQTRLLDGEITHTNPKLGTDVITWDFEWQAPSASGTYRMFAAAVSANLMDRDHGDETGTVSGYPIVVIDPLNRGPIARAGADRTVVDDDGDGVEPVELDGSASMDPDGTIVSWAWSDATGWSGQGEVCTASLAVGPHLILLEVADDHDSRTLDDVLVVVAPAGSRPPRADAGPDHAVVDVDGDGEEVVRIDGSASSDADGVIVSWDWYLDGDRVASGDPPAADPD